MKYVLFDVDGTLIDAVSNQRKVWGTWAERYGLDVGEVCLPRCGAKTL